MYFMVKSCIHTVRWPKLHQNQLYLSPYQHPVPNSTKFLENRNSAEMGKFRGSAQNSAFCRKLWSIIILTDYTVYQLYQSNRWLLYDINHLFLLLHDQMVLITTEILTLHLLVVFVQSSWNFKASWM